MLSLSIIIINYNTFELTKSCIESIFISNKSIKEEDLEIIIIDNNSSETAPIQSLKSLYPSIIVIENEINVGFSKGNNLGLKYASKEYVLFLNSDVILDQEDVLYRSINKIKDYNDNLILTTRLNTLAGKAQVAYGFLPSLKYEFLFSFFLYKFLSVKKRQKLLINFEPTKNREILSGFIVATFYMFKKNLLNKIKENHLYDQLFLYGEELFWGMQWKKAGIKQFYFADESIVHLIGQSSKININYTQKLRRAFQTYGEYQFLINNYNLLNVSLIYLLRIFRFSILSIKDKEIRLRLALIFDLLFNKLKKKYPSIKN